MCDELDEGKPDWRAAWLLQRACEQSREAERLHARGASRPWSKDLQAYFTAQREHCAACVELLELIASLESCARTLVNAYGEGHAENDADSIDWSDVDQAYAYARAALGMGNSESRPLLTSSFKMFVRDVAANAALGLDDSSGGA